MAGRPVTRNASFAFDIATRSLDEQGYLLASEARTIALLVALGLVGGYFLWTRATGGA